MVAAAVLVEAEQQAVALQVRAAQAARRPAQAQVRREPREAPHPASLARRTRGSGNARWRRPGRLKFRRSVERKYGGRSGRDRGTGAAHHQRSERWGWAKC